MDAANQSNRTLYIDILRIIATFAVIVLHVSCENWDMDNLNFEWHVRNIFDSAVRWCVPVFVMISGALFLNPQKHISIRKLYTHNIPRLITAFFLWNIIYSVYDYFANSHYYIKTITQYFLAISFIITFIYPFIVSVISEILPLFFTLNNGILAALTHFYESIDLNLFIGYSGFFVLGHYLNSHECKHTKLIYALGITSFALTVISTAILSDISGSLKSIGYDYLSPLVLFEAVAVFIFIKNHSNRINISVTERNTISRISGLCFGIYLIHVLILWLLSYVDLPVINALPIKSALVFVISLFTVNGLSKIPFCRKYMM